MTSSLSPTLLRRLLRGTQCNLFPVAFLTWKMDNSEDGQGIPCIDLRQDYPTHPNPHPHLAHLAHLASPFCALSLSSPHPLLSQDITTHPHLPLTIADYYLPMSRRIAKNCIRGYPFVAQSHLTDYSAAIRPLLTHVNSSTKVRPAGGSLCSGRSVVMNLCHTPAITQVT